MKIVVCVKHVPDAQSNRSFEDGLIFRGEDDVLNEIDENAIEAAVSIAEEKEDIEVIALTMGPEDASDALRKALQMGADSAVHICDDNLKGSSVLQTARVLSKAIEQISDVSLVLTGMASSDGMTSMLPGYLAETLQFPLLSYVNNILKVENNVEVLRNIDGIEQKLSCELPAVISVTDQVNEPRYPNFKAIAAARKKPIETLELSDLGIELELDNQIEVLSVEQKPAKESGEILLDSPVAIKQLADFIKEKM